MKNYTPLGHARVFRHPQTGELMVDTDSLRRTHFAGDDLAGWDDDDLDEEDFGYDDDFEEDDELGFLRRDPERRNRRKRRRLSRRRNRVTRRSERRLDRITRKEEALDKAADWGATVVSAAETLDRGGSASLKIRLQHDFRAEDLTFTGSSQGAKVHNIYFGDRSVFSAPDGIDVGVFSAQSFLRGLLKGQSIEAGLDIVVNGSIPGPGTLSVALVGLKPNTGGSC